jgi:hypothetical protein
VACDGAWAGSRWSTSTAGGESERRLLPALQLSLEEHCPWLASGRRARTHINAPAPDDLSLQWTATIFRKGFSRTTILHVYSEQLLKEKCAARGVTEFVSRPDT